MLAPFGFALLLNNLNIGAAPLYTCLLMRMAAIQQAA